MKIHFNARAALVLLILLNFCVFSLLIYLQVLINNNATFKVKEQIKTAYLPVVVKATEELRVGSKAFVVYDPVARVVIAGKNEYLRFSPASSAKIMAALTVLENYPLDRVLTAKNIKSVEGSKMGLFEDESMTVENLLYGMMLPSGNDAAYVLSQNFPGGTGSFIQKMNNKAHSLDMVNTKFFDPDGYDDRNYTTAFDLARLGAYAMQNPVFATIVGTKAKTVYDTSGKIEHKLENLNELLGLDGVNGIKTGFTNEAGGVLVTSANSDSKTYILVVMNTPDRFGDTKNLILNAIDRLRLISY